MSPLVYLNGHFIPEDQACVSINDRGFTHGDGLFETVRVKNGRPFRLEKHFARMAEGAKNIFLKLPVDFVQFAEICQTLIEKNKIADAMLRTQVTRGCVTEGLVLRTNTPPTLVIAIKPYDPPPIEWVTQGIRLVLLESSAIRTNTLLRQAKTSSYLSNLLARDRTTQSDCQEAILMTPEGRIAEGTTSNVFVVHKNYLRTPPISEYVLPGVTREAVLECAEILKLESSEEPLTRKQFLTADEIFITNSRVGILPAKEILKDVTKLSAPGEVTRSLSEAYLKLIEAEC